mmetsp:Transcript_17573/g.34566  ORF Transcript_17573/g.34566 Transcript_17573/m.34566 type:complete len:643 (-) Transcript_17573:268-2196(-)|eukprot:CAMPEP_0171504384 /NCGR_PEP_ID=MMETSP0958-20121227/11542_1 /TAXON_ID=87120 /ORGANISM="Aurantiochytrium limacinum, Strain ATCCMYA-1381" /LENGTH=642 /DNA_ID=CAMNT_0012040221 /DNA_START=114 /DNA_END=2042 /DNA_ORIENTATION=+
MVRIDLVPSTEEVLEVGADGTERLLPAPSAADAFAAAVKRLELHKRSQVKRRRLETSTAMDVDNEDAEASKDEETASLEKGFSQQSQDLEMQSLQTQDADQDAQQAAYPFMEVHKQLGYACYELQQLNELTNLLCEKSLFKLESLQADERSALPTLEDSLMAFEMKKVGLRSVLKILGSGKKMLQGSQRVQRAYLMFVQNLQARWRMHAIAHGNVASTLRAQEPLAVDCGFYSAGSRGKATLLRQTRNAARLVVNEEKVHGLESGQEQEALRLDVDPSTFRRLCFEVLDAETGRSLASAFLGPSQAQAQQNPSATDVESQLEGLQANEFSIELFQVLSAEAVRGGELSSYAEVKDRPDGTPSYRTKVVVVENLLRSVTVALDEERHLRITLQSCVDESALPKHAVRDHLLEDYCRTAAIIAEQHQRRIHTQQLENSPLLTTALVKKYRQMDARVRISEALNKLSEAVCANPEPARPRKLVHIRHAWAHDGDCAFLEVWIGPRVLVRCHLAAGELTLVSVAKHNGSLGHLAEVQQAGEHQLATPGSEDKLCALVASLAVYEVATTLESSMLIMEPTCRIRWAPDNQSADILWADDSVENTLRVSMTKDSLQVFLGREVISNTTLQGIARRALLRARESKLTSS